MISAWILGALALPPVLAADAGDEVSGTELPEVFESYEEALDRGNKALAADALVGILDEEDESEHHPRALSLLSRQLADQSLNYAALMAQGQALALDVEPAWVIQLLHLADQVGDEGYAEQVLAGVELSDLPGPLLGEAMYLGARESLRKGDYGTALRQLEQISSDHSLSQRGQLLKGVALHQQGNYPSALVPLLSLNAQLEEAVVSDEDSLRLLDQTRMHLGRTFYALNNFPQAAGYFATIPRSSPLWLESQFERAWAHFRMDDMNGTIGLLHSLSSPFTDDYFYPEGDLLRTYSLFMLCKFPAAAEEIDLFLERYTDFQSEADRQLDGMSPEEVLEDVLRFSQQGESSLPATLLTQFPDEVAFTGTLSAIEALEQELDRMRSVSSNAYSDWARRALEERVEELRRREGMRMKYRMDGQLDTVLGMLNDVQFLKLDILKMKTRLFEQAANTGRMEDARDIARRKARRNSQKLHWTWQGEYWADELGYYRADTVPECPASLTPGG